MKRAAAIAVLVGAGWLAHDEIGRFGVPDTLASPIDASLVEDARQARAVAHLRLVTAADAASYDRDRLRRATGVELPPLPEGWRVRDLQVFPSRHGTGIEVAFEAESIGEVSLFATRADGRSGPAMLGDTAEGRVLAWTSGGNAYAVSGPLRDAVLQRRRACSGAERPRQSGPLGAKHAHAGGIGRRRARRPVRGGPGRPPTGLRALFPVQRRRGPA